VNVYDALDIGASLVKPSVNENFLRRFQTLVSRNFSPGKIDGNNVAFGDKPQPGLFRSACFDENSVFTRQPRAHVTARLFCQIQLP
jgi:hypothetical protein